MLEVAREFRILLAQLLHLINRLRILCGIKHFVKDFFQMGLVAERPIRLILMAEDDIFEDRCGDTQ